MHDLEDELKYLDKNQFEDLKENVLPYDDYDLESGYWCIIDDTIK